jgi:hypothetical protein
MKVVAVSLCLFLLASLVLLVEVLVEQQGA